MFDSLPYRNDAAVIFSAARALTAIAFRRARHRHVRQRSARDVNRGGRSARICPTSLFGQGHAAGGRGGRRELRANARRSFRTRIVSLPEAAELGCRACGSPGGCQFLGTAATSQVVSEALGLFAATLGTRAIRSARGFDMAKRSARALHLLDERKLRMRDILTSQTLRTRWYCTRRSEASTNLLL